MSSLYRLLLGLLGCSSAAGVSASSRSSSCASSWRSSGAVASGPQYTAVDRFLLAAASRLLPPGRCACLPVSAETLRRWHRALLQGDRRSGRRRAGRPPLAAETQSLIERL